MATACGRILFENWALLDATVVTVSSEQLQAPKTFLDDPLRSKRWRTELGWNIDPELNNKVDFVDSGGTKVATLDTSNFTTGTAMAAELTTKMTAASADTITVTYSGVTNKFTLSSSGGTFSLLWNTGANAVFNVGADIGFDTSADDTGLTAYTADFASYGSRSWIKFDFGTGFAALSIDALLAFDGNFISTTSITVEANTTDSWSSPALSTPLQMDSGRDYIKGIEFITATSAYRWWRVVINDARNTDGFTEMGIPYIGEYYEPSNGFSAAFTEDRDELSSTDIAEEGATFQHVRATRLEYPLQWLGIPVAEKSRWDSFADLVQVGRPFFMAFTPTVDIQWTLYVMLGRPMRSVFQAPDYWRFNTNLVEVLG